MNPLYEEAWACTNSTTWHLAMELEINSIQHNKTRDLVELPINWRALPWILVYWLKETLDFVDPKYKAKLVTKGFLQQYGANFDEIFSPVMKMTIVQFPLGVVAVVDLDLIQFDVKMAFIHGDLDEKIYMRQPKGFVAADQEHLVYRLRKSLYG